MAGRSGGGASSGSMFYRASGPVPKPMPQRCLEGKEQNGCFAMVRDLPKKKPLVWRRGSVRPGGLARAASAGRLGRG